MHLLLMMSFVLYDFITARVSSPSTHGKKECWCYLGPHIQVLPGATWAHVSKCRLGQANYLRRQDSAASCQAQVQRPSFGDILQPHALYLWGEGTPAAANRPKPPQGSTPCTNCNDPQVSVTAGDLLTPPGVRCCEASAFLVHLLSRTLIGTSVRDDARGRKASEPATKFNPQG